MENIEIIYTTDIDTYSIESNKKVTVTTSLDKCLKYYFNSGRNNGIRILTHYLTNVFNGSIPPLETKQQVLHIDRILPDWFILYDTDNMLIDSKLYSPPELKHSVGISSEPDYYVNNRLYAWKILELMKDRIDFKLRKNWERNIFSDLT